MRCVTRLLRMCLPVMVCVAAGALFPDAGQAAIVFSGNYSPASDSWNSGVDGYVGLTTDGTVAIDAGDDLASHDGYLGSDVTGCGTVTVSGTGSTWVNSGQLYVGHYGEGEMLITDGALVSNITGNIAWYDNAWGSVKVDGTDATWTNSSTLYVGDGGNGNLYIYNGGRVNCQSAYIAHDATSLSQATVDGSGSTWYISSSYLTVGENGMATLNIRNGGLVDAPNATTSVARSAPYGTCSINFGANGGTLNTKMFRASSEDLVGTGTIQTRGLIGDFDLTFDSVASKTQTITLNQPGQNINVELDLLETQDFGIGYGAGSHGTVMINNGFGFKTYIGYLGYLSDSHGTATVTGAGTSWLCGVSATSTKYLEVGYYGEGTLLIANGAAVNSSRGYIGHYENASGMVRVDNSTWTCKTSTSSYQSLYVGYNGTGVLNIQNGSNVSSGGGFIGFGPDSSGTATVDNSTWTTNNNDIRVGQDGTGRLNIQGGGIVNTGTGDTYVAYNSGADGEIHFGAGGGTLTTTTLLTAPGDLTGTGTIEARGLITDANLTYDAPTITPTLNDGVQVALDMSTATGAGDLGVGYRGTGAMTVNNGAVIYSQEGYLGREAGSLGIVQVIGSGVWNCSSDLHVGDGGTATLSISGGTVSNGTAYVGEDADSSGGVTVGGPTSQWNNSNLYIGRSGNGTLGVYGGAVVNSSAFSIGEYNNSAGTATVNASTLNCTGTTFYVGNSGAGRLNIQGGGLVAANSATTYVAKNSTATGTIDFSAGGGTLSTKGLYTAATDVTGTGSIQANGLVSDVDLTFDSTTTSATLNDAVVVTLDMSTPANNAALGVGYRGNGSLLIRNGTVIESQTGYVGYEAGSSGAAIVSGAGAKWDCSSSYDLYVGYEGTGTLLVTNGADATGGTVSSRYAYIGYEDGAAGTVTITGPGSTLNTSSYIRMGYSGGTATLNIENGGQVTSGNHCYTAYNDASTSAVTVTGAGSMLDLGSKYMYVGYKGDTTVSVEDGGMIDTTSNLYVGYYNHATNHAELSIQSGGTVSNGTAYLAYYYDDSRGLVTVDGAGSTWINSGTVYVGRKGAAELNINNSGTVVASNVMFGDYDTASGTINFDGGILKSNGANSNWLYVDAGAGDIYVKAGGATFDTNGNDMGIAMALQHGDGTPDGGVAKIGDGTLTLTGANTYTGVTTVNGGVLELGTSAQSVIFAFGGADIQSGKLVFDYSGTAPTVEMFLQTSYHAGAWDQGQFLSTTADASHGLGWMDNGVDEVTVMYTLYGDSNLDGSVNGTDLNAVLSYYNQSSEIWNHGDFNYDGSVNGTDLNTVLSNYNQSLPASTAAVPEPSTLLLVVLGLAGLLAWRKRTVI